MTEEILITAIVKKKNNETQESPNKFGCVTRVIVLLKDKARAETQRYHAAARKPTRLSSGRFDNRKTIIRHPFKTEGGLTICFRVGLS